MKLKWYKRGLLLLAAIAVVLGIACVLTRPATVKADAQLIKLRVSMSRLQCLDEQGKPVRNQWNYVYGKEYYFDSQGNLFRDGWVDTVKGRYHLDKAGIVMTGWNQEESGRYYLGTDGRMSTGWVTVDGRRYYFSGDGQMQTGWQELSDGKYLLGADGVMQTGWIDTEEGRRFLDSDGKMHIGWVDTNEGRKFLNADGVMQTGWVSTEEGRYYLDGSGIMQTGWVDTEDGRFYLDARGVMQTGWLDFEGNTYYLNEDGKMASGITQIAGTYYNFSLSGARQTGWAGEGSVKYYFDTDGSMHIGWLTADGKRYYMDGNGMMRTGWIVVEGKSCYFDVNGVYDPSAQKPSVVTKTGPMVALTFDDGPGKYTDRLLDCLEANNVKATFFMLGSNVASYPDVVRRMKQQGSELASHTTNHKQLTKLTPEEIQDEINTTNQKIVDIVGIGASLMRPPYGAYNDTVKQNCPYPLILWSVDTLDWKTLNAQSTVDTILNTVQDGDIILMHDIHKTSVDAAELVIPELIKRGYQLVTVSELAEANGKSLSAGTSYGRIR